MSAYGKTSAHAVCVLVLFMIGCGPVDLSRPLDRNSVAWKIFEQHRSVPVEPSDDVLSRHFSFSDVMINLRDDLDGQWIEVFCVPHRRSGDFSDVRHFNLEIECVFERGDPFRWSTTMRPSSNRLNLSELAVRNSEHPPTRINVRLISVESASPNHRDSR